eukprot:gene4449-3246_t
MKNTNNYSRKKCRSKKKADGVWAAAVAATITNPLLVFGASLQTQKNGSVNKTTEKNQKDS